MPVKAALVPVNSPDRDGSPLAVAAVEANCQLPVTVIADGVTGLLLEQPVSRVEALRRRVAQTIPQDKCLGLNMVELWGPEKDSKCKKFMAEVENSAMTLGIGCRWAAWWESPPWMDGGNHWRPPASNKLTVIHSDVRMRAVADALAR
jgi:hypothetical protein